MTRPRGVRDVAHNQNVAGRLLRLELAHRLLSVRSLLQRIPRTAHDAYGGGEGRPSDAHPSALVLDVTQEGRVLRREALKRLCARDAPCKRTVAWRDWVLHHGHAQPAPQKAGAASSGCR